MNNDQAIEAIVQQYLDNVASHVVGSPGSSRETLIGEVREHIYEAIAIRTSGKLATLQDAYAVLAEMDPPETYADHPHSMMQKESPAISHKLVALSFICVGFQIMSFIMTVATDNHAFSAAGGFAAIVVAFIVWANPKSQKWLIYLVFVAAFCGLGSILLAIAAS